MFQPTDAFRELMDSDKLDGLLTAARTKVAHLVPKQPSSVAEMQQLESEAKTAQANAQEAISTVQESLSKVAERRQQKVALVLHLAQVASRLVG